MSAEWLAETEWPLILRAATHAFELPPERPKFIPARLLVSDRNVAIGGVLKMAAEILDIALHQAGDEAIVDAGYVGRRQFDVAEEAADR